MIPRFTNPYTLQQSSKRVSRADLAHSDQEEPSVFSDAESSESKRKRDELEALMKSSLGDVDAVSKGSTTTEKRRRIDDKEEQTDTMVTGTSALFRLISGSLPPRPVIFQSEIPFFVDVVKIRPSEDDELEAVQRKQRAESVAVDFTRIIQESKMPYVPTANHSKNVIMTQADLPKPPPSLMVTERRRPWPLSPTLRSLQTAPTPSTPVSFEKSIRIDCPIVLMTTVDAQSDSTSKRKPRKRRIKERPPPAFWRPSVEWGGKSGGYAMGYEGSWPASRGVKERYTRDAMRRAVYVDWSNASHQNFDDY